MPRVTASIPDEIVTELQRRADAELRSASSLVRLALRQLLFASDGASIGRGWKLEEDWAGLWATREKAPGVVERVRLENGPGSVVERPFASMKVSE